VSAVAYPPEPWQLRGQLSAAALLVPARDVDVGLPPGWRLVRLRSRVVVGVVWVSYEPGGVLAYRELMVTVLARRGWRVLPHIPAIWVDSVASREGGRALWGIPKALAQFQFTGTRLTAADETGTIAAATIRPRLRLPGRWPVRFSVVQTLDDAVKVSPVRARARLDVTHTQLDVPDTGPLGFLAGRRPVVSFRLRDFTLLFGRPGGGARTREGVQWGR
jgi:hypothetical protein